MKRPVVPIIAGSVTFAALCCATFWIWHSRAETGSDEDSEPATEAPTTVVLSDAKFVAAGLQAEPARRRSLQERRMVPGRIEYNKVHCVNINAPVEAVVREILVKPGDAVDAGDRLAVLDSSEIGLLRSEVDRNRADLRIANQSLEWAEEITANLDRLLKVLQSKPKPEEVEKAFEGRALGDHRQHVLAAYSKFVLADELSNDIEKLVATGATAIEKAKQRKTNRDVAYDDYVAVCEQSRFDARLNLETVRAKREYARGLLEVSQQKLSTALGAYSKVSETGLSASSGDSEIELTRFFLVAPFAGTVEQRTIAQAQRLSAGAPSFVVADTTTLWAAAEIRERDWQAISLNEGTTVTVAVPALEGREFSGQVEFVGRAVERESRAVPLVAVVDNSARLLKPGMFAWVWLPVGQAVEALAVPPGAVMTHEGREFVFVNEGDRAYRRVDVAIGLRTPEWVAVETGLVPGQEVVTQGAFVLKSELLVKHVLRQMEE